MIDASAAGGERALRPLRIINSVAPIRICDNGGWTDTWFAGHGRIFNIGVYPYAEVQIEVYPAGATGKSASSSTPRTTASATWSTPKRAIGTSIRCWKPPSSTCASRRPGLRGDDLLRSARRRLPPAPRPR